ncbi:hypothetical protein DJ021_09200 [Phenylobacterium hankyongense]|uniref:Uncharacterized protein n=1 Tax=Phenylobacterium hankyongense TaxID=1813876 RepID=A0A328AZE8_9CAUL|nr:tetratricopeptide repeat protein [Phenylobacterium hankyongense]RAK59967.1 hypothetical protein DJ021_09200 [Phenylobacterium hankyongense]
MAALLDRALAHHGSGDLRAAEALYRQILQTEEHPGVLQNLASMLRERGELEAARALLLRALAVASEPGPLHHNLGNVLLPLRRLEEAAAAFESALKVMPEHRDAALNLGLVRLAQGRWAEGWPLYEQRPERLNSPTFGLRSPEWRGEPLAGKRLLVWGEQGLGDQIMMARFLPRLGASAILAVRAPLARLLSPLAAEVIVKGDGAMPLPPHDYWTLPLSLPRWQGVTVETLPTAPYLSGRPASRGGVGVMWRGNALPDPRRSLPDELGRPLLALPGARSLHPDDTGARDLQDTADIIAGLDLVISVDTAVAHLAGALGKPCWLLLQRHVADWRWLWDEQMRSLWYPSIEIFRQPVQGDWLPVLAEVRRRLGQ